MKTHIIRLETLPKMNFHPAKPATPKPGPWIITRGILNAQASVYLDINDNKHK